MSRKIHFLPGGGGGGALGVGLGLCPPPRRCGPSGGGVWPGRGQRACKRRLASCRTVALFHDMGSERMGVKGLVGRTAGSTLLLAASAGWAPVNVVSTYCVPDTAEALWHGDLCFRGSSRARGTG